MSWFVAKKNFAGKVPTWRGFICDTIADIATLPTIPAVAPSSECYCSENGATYVLETDGDWVLKSTGSSTISVESLNDVDIDNPTNGQILIYNGETGKWENGGIPAQLPVVTGDDDNKVLMVVDGQWAVADFPS